MARVKFGGLAQDVKGKLSGLVFQGGPAGAIVRQKVSGTGGASPGQVIQRSRFLEGRRVWRSLTHAQRVAWAVWSEAHPVFDSFGNSRTPSGSEACTAVNGQRLALGLAATAVPPGDPLGVPAQIGEVATVTPGTVRITWSAATGPQVGERHQVLTCGTAGPGVSFLGRGWAAVGVHVVTGPGGSEDFDASAVCPRFQWEVGDLVAVRVRRFSAEGALIDTVQFPTVAQTEPVPPQFALRFAESGETAVGVGGNALRFGAAEAFCWEWWSRVEVRVGANLFALGNDGWGYQGWMVGSGSGEVTFLVEGGNGGYFVFLGSMNDGLWHHYAVQWTGSAWACFVDGAANAGQYQSGYSPRATGPCGFVSMNNLADGAYELGPLRGSRGLRYLVDFVPPRVFVVDPATVVGFNFAEGSGLLAADIGPLSRDWTLSGNLWIPFP